MLHFFRLVTFFSVLLLATGVVAEPPTGPQLSGGEPQPCVILVTIDGLRWQELLEGADQRLINEEHGNVDGPDELRARLWRESASERRELLMPFMWSTIREQGQILGDGSKGSSVRVTNGLNFSYPGYSEILCGFADSSIDSNAKTNNQNTTVLEWLHDKSAYRGSVFAFASWDVFPFIINSQRSGIPVNAGWQPFEGFDDQRQQADLNRLAAEMPKYWRGVRYDAFTIRGALTCLKERRPRVLYVALGETDDWGHAGRYDLYLHAAEQSDDYLRQLWETAQSLPTHRGRTTMIVTTDHGRGDGRESWKSHGESLPESDRIWIAAIGPEVPALGLRGDVQGTQSQVAATLATALGEAFHASDPRVAAPIEFTPR